MRDIAGPELTILMPCLDEARTLGTCVRKAQTFLSRSAVVGEVLVADNGSHDGSQAIAKAAGARVIDVPLKGYGAALIAGIAAARGRYVIMGDSDDSYDFAALDDFVARLREGCQLVMGNRFKGGIKPGAMPPLHRYFGNPVLSGIGRLFFGAPIGDFHCGLRGFERDAIRSLDLQALGMEFASEMVVKATLGQLRIAEVPTTLSPDGRGRPPHLRSWRDGWRHLRFLLLFSPAWLFLYPGLALMLSGLAGMIWLLPAPRVVGGITFDIHTLLYAAVFLVVGFQAVMFWIFSKLYAMREGFMPPDPAFRRVIDAISLELGLLIGAVLLTFGLGASIYALGAWGDTGFGALTPNLIMRIVIPSSAAILLALQLMHGAFFVSILDIRSTRGDGA
jgi:glycosyltransferase involved in cell wall biosynthesis